MAATKALDDLFMVDPPPAARKLRELFYSAFFVTDHTTHFYALGGPDFIIGPDAPPSDRNILGVLRKVRESAEHAERTAEVATRARETAEQGVAAAQQANDAMGSVTDPTAAVTTAIRELAGKSEQIGAIVQTITGIAEQTNLLETREDRA